MVILFGEMHMFNEHCHLASLEAHLELLKAFNVKVVAIESPLGPTHENFRDWMALVASIKKKTAAVAKKCGLSMSMLEDGTPAGRLALDRQLIGLMQARRATEYEAVLMKQHLHFTRTCRFHAKLVAEGFTIVGIDSDPENCSAPHMMARSNDAEIITAREQHMVQALLALQLQAQDQHVLCIVGVAHILPIAAGLKNAGVTYYIAADQNATPKLMSEPEFLWVVGPEPEHGPSFWRMLPLLFHTPEQKFKIRVQKYIGRQCQIVKHTGLGFFNVRLEDGEIVNICAHLLQAISPKLKADGTVAARSSADLRSTAVPAVLSGGKAAAAPASVVASAQHRKVAGGVAARSSADLRSTAGPSRGGGGDAAASASVVARSFNTKVAGGVAARSSADLRLTAGSARGGGGAAAAPGCAIS